MKRRPVKQPAPIQREPGLEGHDVMYTGRKADASCAGAHRLAGPAWGWALMLSPGLPLMLTGSASHSAEIVTGVLL